MIKVTDRAAQKIRSMLEEEGRTDYGLRMMVIGGGCSGFQYRLEFDQSPKESDRQIESNGVKVFIDMKSSLYLAGSQLDYTDGLMGAGFKIDNPNARSTCGCGESFSV